MAMEGFALIARLSADTKNFKAGMTDAKNALNELHKSSTSTMGKVRDTLTGVGKGLTAAITLPLGAVAGASVKAFSDFDTALIGVQKTTDISGQALQQYGKDILAMTREMPVSAVELANLSEMAGQLGISAEDGGKHLLEFAKISAQMGVATNMSSEEAGNAMARLANITQMPQTEFARLGSVIVGLGNNMATTESEITEMGLRLAGTGSQIGLTEAQIMALAAGMSSVGINAEAGGSAMSRVMQKINTAVLSSSDKMEGFAKVSGMSAQEFSDTWKNDPQTAITEFVKGLGRVKESGGDVTGTLKELGLKSIQEIDTMARLAGAGDLLADAFDTANGAWEEGIALQKENDAFAKSFANQLKKLKNALFEAGTVIGEKVAPYVGMLADKIKDVINWFNDLDPKIQDNIVKWGMIIAAIGPVLMILSKLISVGMGIASLVMPVVKFLGSIKSLAGAMALLKYGWGLLKASFVAHPFGWIVIAIMAVIAIFKALGISLEDVKNFFLTAWEAIKSAWSTAGEFFSNLWTAIKEGASNIWDSVVETWNATIEGIKTAWNGIKEFFVGLWESIKTTATNAWTALTEAIMAVVQPFIEGYLYYWENMKGSLEGIWEGIKMVFSGAWEFIKSIFMGALLIILDLVTSNFTQLKADMDMIWESIKSAVSLVWEGIKMIFTNHIQAMIDFAKVSWQGFKGFLSSLWEGIKSTAISAWEGLKSSVSNIINSLINGAKSAWEGFRNSLSNIMESIKSFVTNAWENIKSAVTNAVTNMVNSAVNTFNSFKSSVSGVVDGIGNILRGIANIDLSGAGQAIMQGFLNGLQSMWGAVTDFVGGIAGWIRNNKGPISYDRRLLIPAGKAIMNGLGGGLEDGFGKVQSLVSGMGGRIADTIGGANMALAGDYSGMLQSSVQSTVDVELGRQAKPLELNLQLGSRSFSAFVEDINTEAGKLNKIRLKTSSL